MHWSWMRLAAGAAGLSGVVAGFIVNVDRATRQGQDLGLVLANYFSLFTIITTMLSVVALTAAAVVVDAAPRHVTRTIRRSRSALAVVTGPMLLLGIVYNVLLRGLPSEVALADAPGIAFLDHWAIEVLHVVLPIYLLVDLLFATRRRGLPWKTLFVIVGYPLAWITYTMIRGELTPDPSGSNPLVVPLPVPRPARPRRVGIRVHLHRGAHRPASRHRSDHHRHRTLPRTTRNRPRGCHRTGRRTAGLTTSEARDPVIRRGLGPRHDRTTWIG